jgi:hypothetical protein
MIWSARASGDRYVLPFPLYCLFPFPNILNRDATTRHLSAVRPTNLQSVWKARSESLHDTHHEYKERYVKFLFLSFTPTDIERIQVNFFFLQRIDFRTTPSQAVERGGGGAFVEMNANAVRNTGIVLRR